MEEINADNNKKNMIPIVGLGIIAIVIISGFILYSQANNKPENVDRKNMPDTKETTGSMLNADIETSNINNMSPLEQEGSAPLDMNSTTISDSQPGSSNVKVIEVEAGSYYFKPSVITLKKGEKVKIVLNSVSMMHDLLIDELKVKIPVTTNGNTNSIEFIPDKSGTFEYYCSVGNHRKMGQVGKITVQ